RDLTKIYVSSCGQKVGPFRCPSYRRRWVTFDHTDDLVHEVFGDQVGVIVIFAVFWSFVQYGLPQYLVFAGKVGLQGIKQLIHRYSFLVEHVVFKGRQAVGNSAKSYDLKVWVL